MQTVAQARKQYLDQSIRSSSNVLTAHVTFSAGHLWILFCYRKTEKWKDIFTSTMSINRLYLYIFGRIFRRVMKLPVIITILNTCDYYFLGLHSFLNEYNLMYIWEHICIIISEYMYINNCGIGLSALNFRFRLLWV